MQIYFLRHATFVLTFNGAKILVDPMLSPAEAMDPVANAANSRRIPLVDLPLTIEALPQTLNTIDAVLVTHTHRDHWDARAVELLSKSLPIFCHPDSESTIRDSGFTAVTPITDHLEWRGIEFYRTGGQHRTGEIGQKMGTVSGFVLKAVDEPSLYIAGDTIWCVDVQTALQTHRPDQIVVNAGAAQFLTGDPITMNAEDVARVCRAAPSARIIAVHMGAINHCLLTRAVLRDHLQREGLAGRVMIPADGEIIAP